MYPAFRQYIGIDYSGAGDPQRSQSGIRVFLAERDTAPVAVSSPKVHGKHWSRQALAEWLREELRMGVPKLVGIDHAFSFPMQYFDRYHLKADWNEFLVDFRQHWPTDIQAVEALRRQAGQMRAGKATWRRLTEIRAGGAKSVFHFDVPGQVAKSTHAGLPWLLFLRNALGDRIHFWPFDGWEIPAGKSALAEIYPSLWNHTFPIENRTPDEHDAYVSAAWLCTSDQDGSLANYLRPDLTPEEYRYAQIEGWILGVR